MKIAPLCIGSALPLLFATVTQAEPPPGVTVLRDGTSISGVSFRVWAPNATSVSVLGGFNSWTETPMVREGDGVHWSTSVPGARPGDEYKYLLRWDGNPQGEEALDPRSLWIRTNGDGKMNSVIYDHSAFDWGTNKTVPYIPPGDKVMYELHVGTFHDPDPTDGRPGTFDDAISRLPYLRRLGINVVALMPVAEFFTATSWGYNPQYPFAVEDSYGGPDGLKRFVKEAHRLGMSVQLDIVHNHYGDAGGDADLMRFGGAPYFYGTNSPIGRTRWGPRPNYAEPNVRALVTDSVRMFLDEYAIGGLRWDSPRNIMGFDASSTGFHDMGEPQTVIPEGKAMVAGINEAMRTGAAYPGRWSVSEDSDLLVPDGLVAYEDPFLSALQVADPAQSFDGHWQTSFHNAITPQVALSSPSVSAINSKVSDWSEPPGWRVVFTDNHDKAGDLNRGAGDGGTTLVGWRLANRLDPDNQGAGGSGSIPVTNSMANPVVRDKVLLSAVLTLTAPGVPMLLMGQEFGATGSFGDTNRTDWREASRQSAVFRAHRDLVRLRTSLPGLRNLELEPGGSSAVSGGVLTYWRTNGVAPPDQVFVALNFSGEAASVTLTNLPSTGDWYVRVHTGWTIYGGETEPGTGALSSEGTLLLPARTAAVLAKTPPGAGELDPSTGGIATGWLDLFGVANPGGDEDGDGLDNLREYQLGLDPLEADTAAVTYNGKTRAMRSTGENSVAQYVGFFAEAVPATTASQFMFLSNSIPGPFFTSPAGSYGRFLLNLTNYSSSHSHFFAQTNLSIADANRTNWAAYHGVSDFGANADGDDFTNLQEFARGSDPNSPSRSTVTVAGSFNGWNLGAHPMRFAGGTSWNLGIPGRGGRTEEFKFTAGDWSLGNWGDSSPRDGIGDPNGANIPVAFDRGNGIYRLRFDEETLAYAITHDSADADGDGIQDDWVRHHGLEGADAAAGADPDGDGWSNLAEFTRFANADGSFMNPAAAEGEAAPKRMTVTGSLDPLPAWDPTASNMEWSDRRMRWEWTGTFTVTSNIEFKFSQATDKTEWTGGATWGREPGSGATSFGSRGGAENLVAAVTNGVRYRFSFDDLTGAYSVEPFPVSSEWWEESELEGAAPGEASDGRWSYDPDRDGHSHRMEYALGGNPSRGGERLVSSWATNAGGTNRLVMQWLERTNGGDGLSIVPMLSTNLSGGGWTALVPSNAAATGAVPPGHRRMEVSVPMDGGRKFLRVRVTGP